MDQKDVKGEQLSLDKDTRISLTVNRGSSGTGNVIELNRVFHNMHERRGIYAWLMVLCMLVGLCVPLLMAQFTQSPATVSSVVTLEYQVPVQSADGMSAVSYQDVTDLTAPDGSELDLNMLKSSYVLSKALDSVNLNGITVTNLRRNVKVERILTEDSRRQQEVASSMISAKNASAYQQVQDLELVYENQFIVSITNGFGDENSSARIYLTDAELKLLLNQLLEAYNDYLVRTYAFKSLPEDRLSLADPDSQDILECLDIINEALENLQTYCRNQPERVRTYRSSRTGYALTGLMDVLSLLRREKVDSLYAFVKSASVAKVPQQMISHYQYKLDSTNTSLTAMQKTIDTAQKVLDEYQNDSVMISGQGTDAAMTITTTTDYYNQMVLSQAANYASLAQIEVEAAELEGTLMSLKPQKSSDALLAQAGEELNECLVSARTLYDKIRDHMTEVFSAAFYTDYMDYSAAQGSTTGVISRASRNMVIGAALGAVIALVIWVIAGLAPEFKVHRENDGKERAVKEA